MSHSMAAHLHGLRVLDQITHPRPWRTLEDAARRMQWPVPAVEDACRLGLLDYTHAGDDLLVIPVVLVGPLADRILAAHAGQDIPHIDATPQEHDVDA